MVETTNNFVEENFSHTSHKWLEKANYQLCGIRQWKILCLLGKIYGSSQCSPNEAFEFLNYVAEISRSWDKPHERNLHKSKSQSNSKGGMYMLNEDVDLQAKIIGLKKKLEELEAKGFYEVNAIYDNPIYMEQCSSCQSIEHEVSDCPTIPAIGERLVENHPNMSWNCGQE